MKRQQKQQRLTLVVVALLTLVFVGLVGWWALASANQSDDAQNNATTQSSVHPSQQPAQDQEQEAAAAELPPGQMVKISELGLQLYVTENLKDISYTVTERNTEFYKSKVASFTTQTIQSKNAACTAAAAPIGSITRTEGTFPTEPNYQNTNGLLMNQFDTYYVGYRWPEAPCDTNPDTEKLIQDLRTSFREALYGIAPIN